MAFDHMPYSPKADAGYTWAGHVNPVSLHGLYVLYRLAPCMACIRHLLLIILAMIGALQPLLTVSNSDGCCYSLHAWLCATLPIWLCAASFLFGCVPLSSCLAVCRSLHVWLCALLLYACLAVCLASLSYACLATCLVPFSCRLQCFSEAL